MATSAAHAEEPATPLAYAIWDAEAGFDGLAETLDAELDGPWTRVGVTDAAALLWQAGTEGPEIVVVALAEAGEEALPWIGGAIEAAKAAGAGVLLVTGDVTAMTLHGLLRSGADDFLPYPVPEGALGEAIARMRAPDPPAPAPPSEPASGAPGTLSGGGNRAGTLLPVHGLAGGVGATAFAVNLAWELATPPRKGEAPRVCLFDLDVQFGSAATYLDLPRRDAVYELLADVPAMDADAFMQALVTVRDRLHVLTAPADVLPLDFLGPEDVAALIETARSRFDYIVVDMPTVVVQWTETVLARADVYTALVEVDMRSAQNALRLIRTLKAEDLPIEKLRFAVNRAPRRADMTRRTRMRRMAESLDVAFEIQLPDGGPRVRDACDHGLPLAETARRNPLRKEIRKLAEALRRHAAEGRAAG